MALGLTQPIIYMSTINISWVKSDRGVGQTTLQLSCFDCFEIINPRTPGTFFALITCNGTALLFMYHLLITTDRNIHRITSIKCRMNTVVTLDDGQIFDRNM